jgi:hypothetical protein
MSPKELKKLAAACRSAGILTFKNSEVEFTLSEFAPESKRITQKVQTGAIASMEEDKDHLNSLTEEQMLLWSVQGIPEESTQ